MYHVFYSLDIGDIGEKIAFLYRDLGAGGIETELYGRERCFFSSFLYLYFFHDISVFLST